MNKRDKILLSVWLFLYVLALVAFHVTYEYTTYWEEEATVVIRYSLLYFAIGIVLYFVLRKRSIYRISDWSIKQTSIVVAYASALKAILCICPFLYYGYFSSVIPFSHTIAWASVSLFFFTLYKNMQ